MWFLYVFSPQVFTHWGACIWYTVGYYSSEPGVPTSSWIYSDSISSAAVNQSSGWILYFRSIYWALATTSTIGYGDIVPVTWGEMAYCIVFAFVATNGYQLILAGLTLMLDQFAYAEEAYKSEQNQTSQLVYSRLYEVYFIYEIIILFIMHHITHEW
jgi:hypothetical protein